MRSQDLRPVRIAAMVTMALGALTPPAFDGDDGEDGDSSLIGSRIVPNGGDGGRGINCVANGIQGQPGVGGPGGEGGSNEDYSDNRGDAGTGECIIRCIGCGHWGSSWQWWTRRTFRYSHTGCDNSVNPIAGTNGGRGTNGANGVDGFAVEQTLVKLAVEIDIIYWQTVLMGHLEKLAAAAAAVAAVAAGSNLTGIMLAAAAAAVAQCVPAKVDARDLAAAAPSRCTRLVYRTSSLQF